MYSLDYLKGALIPLWLSAGMSTENAAVQKKIYGWGTTALTISNEKIDDKMKIVKLLEESGLLIKWISKTIKNKAKERRKVDFFQCYYKH